VLVDYRKLSVSRRRNAGSLHDRWRASIPTTRTRERCRESRVGARNQLRFGRGRAMKWWVKSEKTSSSNVNARGFGVLRRLLKYHLTSSTISGRKVLVSSCRAAVPKAAIAPPIGLWGSPMGSVERVTPDAIQLRAVVETVRRNGEFTLGELIEEPTDLMTVRDAGERRVLARDAHAGVQHDGHQKACLALR
jgi:hypothetical protein